MPRYLTSQDERVLAERMATDYAEHGASIRVLMFQEGLSYSAVHRLLTQVAKVVLRPPGTDRTHHVARAQFDDLDHKKRDLWAGRLAEQFAQGARITTLAGQYELHPHTVMCLLQHAGVCPVRRLDRAPYGSKCH